MAIKIVEDGPEIVIGRSEYERLARDYRRDTMHMVDPPTLEEYIRAHASYTTKSNSGLDLSSDLPLKSCAIPGNGESCESCQ